MGRKARRVGVAAATALLISLPGCSLGGGGDSSEEAADAAGAYQADLDAFARKLRTAEQKGQGLDRALADPPELESIDSDESSYATASELADRVDPMVAELTRLAGIEHAEHVPLAQKLYNRALAQATDALRRGNQHLTASSNNSILAIEGNQEAADAAERRLDLIAMNREIRDWDAYKRELQRQPARTQLTESFVDYQLSSADEAIDLYSEYLQHLRDNPPNRAQFEYYDTLWPDQKPFTSVAASVFTTSGDPFYEGLQDGARIIRSLVSGIGRLAEAGEVGPRSPSVGDGYREAIVDGFVSPLDEDDKEVVNKVPYRGWMLYRIKQLEETPDDVYSAARQTLMLELVADERNAFEQLLAALAGLDSTNAYQPEEFSDLVAYVELMRKRLSEPYPPILERTREGFLDAVDTIDVDALKEAYAGGGIPDFDELDMIDRAATSYDKAVVEVKRVLRAGAKLMDSPKQRRQALIDAVEATQPTAAG